MISLWVKSQDITTSERESIQQLKVSHLRILGYSIAIPEQSSPYGPAGRDEQFWRSDLECLGNEESLEDCIGKDNPTCARGEVAGVVCYLGGKLKKREKYFKFKLQLIRLMKRSQHLYQQF